MPTMFFTDADDSFTVTAAGNYGLVFFDGNDRLTVNGGTFTTATMGEDDDVVTLKAGDGLIYGDGGNDRFEIYAGGFEARGGADDDVFNIRGGNALALRGDGGNDQFNFRAGSTGTTIHAGDGNDLFDGSGQTISGNLYGDAGNDRFVGFRNAGGIASNLRGGLGNDTYRAHPSGPANFIENAGEGIDTVEVSGGRNYTLGANIENLIADAFAGTTTNDANLTGNDLANVIHGTVNDETIGGLGGNDKLYGGDGNDALNGGVGNDVLDGEAGGDSMSGGEGNDTYHVDDLDDVVIEPTGSAGGIDLVVTAINYTLAAHVENGKIAGGDHVILTGNTGSNMLTGGAGIDHLIGGAGNDILNGAGGADIMLGGTGNDQFTVDNRYDRVSEIAGEGTDTLHLNLILPLPDDPFAPPSPGPSTYGLDANVENLVIVNFSQQFNFGLVQGLVYGNSLDNVITDSDVNRTISGGGGADTIYGNGGHDYLLGGSDADTIIGGDGDDEIVGDGNSVTTPMSDTLTGGTGSDSFYYYDVSESAPFIFRSDQITDFETGFDKISLIVDADANTTGQQDWTVVDGFTGVAGQLWIDSSDSANGNYVILGDNNGDSLADLMINVHAVTTFAASDIAL